MISVMGQRGRGHRRVNATSTYGSLVQADAPLFYWPMGEAAGATTYAATVGSTAITAGTSTAKPTAGVTGQVDGTAVQFDGSNDFASVALNLSAYSKVVVEFLLYWDAYSNNDSMAMEFTTNASSNAGAFYVDPNSNAPANGLFHLIARGDVQLTASAYTRPSAAAWHHYAAVIDFTAAGSAETNLYVDGVALTAASRPFNSDNTGTFANSTLYIMSRAGASLFGAGKMQHLAIYNTLTAARVLAHAQAAGF